MGEGDYPLEWSMLRVPLPQPGIVEPDSMPSPRKRGEGAAMTAVLSDAVGLAEGVTRHFATVELAD